MTALIPHFGSVSAKGGRGGGGGRPKDGGGGAATSSSGPSMLDKVPLRPLLTRLLAFGDRKGAQGQQQQRQRQRQEIGRRSPIYSKRNEERDITIPVPSIPGIPKPTLPTLPSLPTVVTVPTLPTVTATLPLPKATLQACTPVETPPTEYLPYAPPPDYTWPPGYTPDNENPKPSEGQAPPGGWAPANNNNGDGAGQGKPTYLTSSNKHHGLSAKDIVGIVFGFLGGLVVLVVVVWWIWRRQGVGGGGGGHGAAAE